MVKDLVELHGGTISVESRVGEGAQFTVEVPFGTDRPGPEHPGRRGPEHPGRSGRLSAYVEEARRWLDTEPVAVAVPEPGSEAGSERRPRVLVADDNADMRAYLAKILVPEHGVQLVPDGWAALERAWAEPGRRGAHRRGDARPRPASQTPMT